MTLVSILHIALALVVIVLVLIQDSKGGGMGGAFGGSSSSANSLLGATGAPTFLAKLTRYVVVGFAVTSIILTNLSSNKGKSALDGLPPAETGTAPSNPVVPSNPAVPTEAAPAEAPQPTGN